MNVVGRIGLAIVSTSLLVSGCSSAAGSSSKAGPETAPVTLHVATNDSADEPVGPMLEAFAAKAKEFSGGSIVIEPAFGAAGPGPEWDQRNARLVVDGSMEMGMIPSRAWDTEGVTTLRALNAPLLITSDGLTNKVVQSDLATTLMSGLDKAGVTGLALYPEGLRHPFSYGAPLTSAESFVGKTLRSPASMTVGSVLAHLGASSNDAETNPQTHDGMESSYGVAPQATATGNVTFFPKVDVLVINSKVLADLSADQRDALQKAAITARDEVLAQQRPDAEQAAEYCTNGGAVVLATADQIASIERAVQPVYDELNKDETTRTQIEKIRAMKNLVPAPAPVQACGKPVDQQAAAQPASTAAPIDPSTLNGVYRFEITDADLASVGWTKASQQQENHGIFTWTLKDGSGCLKVKATNKQSNDGFCGKYVVTPEDVTFTYTDNSQEIYAWTKAANGDLTMRVKQRVDSLTNAMALHPWVRIGDAS